MVNASRGYEDEAKQMKVTGGNGRPMLLRILCILAALCTCLGSSLAQEKPEVFPQLAHSGIVNSVAFSPDRRTLASGSADGSVKLWDIASGREIRTLSGQALLEVTSIAFSPDGLTLASGNFDGTVKLWEVASGRDVNTLRGHSVWVVTSVVFSPDGEDTGLGQLG